MIAREGAWLKTASGACGKDQKPKPLHHRALTHGPRLQGGGDDFPCIVAASALEECSQAPVQPRRKSPAGKAPLVKAPLAQPMSWINSQLILVSEPCQPRQRAIAIDSTLLRRHDEIAGHGHVLHARRSTVAN